MNSLNGRVAWRPLGRSVVGMVVGRWGALVLLALLAGLGGATVDDTYVTRDEQDMRDLGLATARYVMGMDDALLRHYVRFYGVAFELPLVGMELALDLRSLRSVYTLRHLVNHFLFLVAGLACYLLAQRLFNNDGLAFVALLLFVLHPRLYAHSLFNTKDIPFLSLFAITLLLAHHAFRKGSAAAFVACGMATALATNIRIGGLMLFVGVLGVRLLDLARAGDRRERIRVTRSVVCFVVAAGVTCYCTWPYLWADPIGRFLDAFAYMGHHQEVLYSLFQGVVHSSANLPPHYLVTWIAITTPPATLLLAAIGVGVVLWRATRRSATVLRDDWLRFHLMLCVFLALPLVVVAVLGSHVYHGWRHVYFVHAPLVLLAITGLSWLLTGPRGWRIGISGLTLTALIATAWALSATHPNGTVYFNYLVDRKTPQHLAARYDLDYYGASLSTGGGGGWKSDPWRQSGWVSA